MTKEGFADREMNAVPFAAPSLARVQPTKKVHHVVWRWALDHKTLASFSAVLCVETLRRHIEWPFEDGTMRVLTLGVAAALTLPGVVGLAINRRSGYTATALGMILMVGLAIGRSFHRDANAPLCYGIASLALILACLAFAARHQGLTSAGFHSWFTEPRTEGTRAQVLAGFGLYVPLAVLGFWAFTLVESSWPPFDLCVIILACLLSLLWRTWATRMVNGAIGLVVLAFGLAELSYQEFGWFAGSNVMARVWLLFGSAAFAWCACRVILEANRWRLAAARERDEST